MGLEALEKSQTHFEFDTSVIVPSSEEIAVITKQRNADQDKYSKGNLLLTVVMSVSNMTEMMHTQNDHYHRDGDTIARRKQDALLKAMETALPAFYYEYLVGLTDRLLLFSTLLHPWGLGPARLLSKIAFAAGTLGLAAALRINSNPPAVNRLFIVLATLGEIESWPVGLGTTAIFAREKAILQEAARQVREDPVKWSDLSKYYGQGEPKKLSKLQEEAIGKLIPMCVGFIVAFHGERQGKEAKGLGLAQSIENVKRTHGVSITHYSSMWTEYADESTEVGLVKFIQTAQIAQINITTLKEKHDRAAASTS